jgi:tungstate transport system ATP-binding protein
MSVAREQTPRIEARGVRVERGGRAILELAELRLAPGEILAVLGPNGAGKSTLVQVLGLLLRPDAGQLRIGGEPVRAAREHELRRQLACVFQSPLLLDRSVRENVELGLRLRRVPAAERRARADTWLARLGLARLADQRARTLSGGEAQRVNLARALALAPEVLLLDEPLGGLDAPTRKHLLDELGPLVREGAGAAVLVTHARGEALALGDRVAVLLDGRLRQVGSPDEVFARPADAAVAEFVGVENLLPGRAADGKVRLDGGTPLTSTDRRDGAVLTCFRAEEVRLDPGDAAALRGIVRRLGPRGDGFLAELAVGGDVLHSAMTRADLARRPLAPGDEIALEVRPAAVHLLPR